MQKNDMESKLNYPVEHFLHDINKLQDDVPVPMTIATFEEFCEIQFREFSFSDVMYRSQVLMLCAAYFQEHTDDFDDGPLAVTGDDEALVTTKLLRAVHAWYAGRRLTELGSRPKPTKAEILQIIKEG